MESAVDIIEKGVEQPRLHDKCQSAVVLQVPCTEDLRQRMRETSQVRQRIIHCYIMKYYNVIFGKLKTDCPWTGPNHEYSHVTTHCYEVQLA